MRVDVALEWFLNPDHLPFLAGIRKGWFREAGLEVALIVPDAHYDGMAAVTEGRVAFACNEPLHMLDAARPGLRALGCFFETEGGVLMTKAGAERLAAGEPVRIASPVSGDVTDRIARAILTAHAAGAGPIAIEEAGFDHLANLEAGYDGAWLCFHNFEVVGARLAGLAHVFIPASVAGFPNFSALELFTSERFLQTAPEAVAAMQAVLGRAVTALRDDPEEAAAIWFAESGEADTPLARAVLADTIPRFVAPVAADPERWRPLFEHFTALGFSAVDAAGYERLFGGGATAGAQAPG